jgi:hypothetical protein
MKIENDWMWLFLSFALLTTTLINFSSFHWWPASTVILMSSIAIYACVKSILQKQFSDTE